MLTSDHARVTAYLAIYEDETLAAASSEPWERLKRNLC